MKFTLDIDEELIRKCIRKKIREDIIFQEIESIIDERIRMKLQNLRTEVKPRIDSVIEKELSMHNIKNMIIVFVERAINLAVKESLSKTQAVK